MAEEIVTVSPLTKYWLRETKDETWQDVEENYFTSTN
jgi:hypothetical protein